MKVSIFPEDIYLRESLERVLRTHGADADIELCYYFIFPELYSKNDDLVVKANTKNTLFIFLVTEDIRAFQSYYPDFAIFESHYPSILIKIPQELSKLIQLADVPNQRLFSSLIKNKQFLTLPEILKHYDLISKQFRLLKQSKHKWEGEFPEPDRQFYQQLAEASRSGEAIESFLDIEHNFMNGILPSFDNLDELYKLYFQKDFSRSILYYDRICQLVTSNSPVEQKPLNILIVDDEIINDELDDLKGILLGIKEMFNRNNHAVFTFYYPKQGWEFFVEQMYTQESDQNIKAIECTPLGEKNQTRFKKLSDMDFVLLDLYFRDKQYTGGDILKQLNRKIPELPVFILTKSHDIDMIRDTFMLKADCFITKNRVVALPYYVYRFYKEIGLLLSFLEGKQRRHLLGCLRYWRQNPDFLWFGDKCYHMVDHSFKHTMNDWKIANDLLYPILSNDPKLISPKDIYCLCMAIWLHDIGHKGNKRYGVPHEIRDNHGIIAGELILTHPELFRIYCATDDYKDTIFPFGPTKKPVTQIIKERIEERGDKQPNIVEKIALISIYHMSSAPLSKSDYRQMINRDKYVSKEYFTNSNRMEEEITLADIVGNDLQLGEIVALFRFVDALDINKNRVGDPTEKNLKMEIAEQDIVFQISKLKEEIELMLKQNCAGDRRQDEFIRLSLIKMFYQDVKEKIEKRESISHIELSKIVEDLEGLKLEEFENYFSLSNYASFLSVQKTHFSLHSFIDRAEIERTDPSKPRDIEIHYYSNQTMEVLEKEKIRELRKTDKAIKDHLVGTKEKNWEDGYVFEELNKGKDLLKYWFDNIKVVLHDSEDKKIESDNKKLNPF